MNRFISSKHGDVHLYPLSHKSFFRALSCFFFAFFNRVNGKPENLENEPLLGQLGVFSVIVI